MSKHNSQELEDAIIQVINDQIARHLEERAEYVSESELSVSIRRLKFGDVAAHFNVEVSGVINGKSVRFKEGASRSDAHHVGGGIVGLLAVAAIHAATTTALGAANAEQKLIDCVDEVIAKIQIRLDRLIHVPLTADGLKWMSMKRGRWITSIALYGGSLPVCCMYELSRRDNKQLPVGMMLVSSAVIMFLPAACLFVCLYCVSILRMKNEFFDAEPQGRRIIVGSGVQTIVQLRILCIVLVISFLACLLGLVWRLFLT